MSTRTEITAWLREAGVHEAKVHLHRGGTSEEADEIQEVWDERAAKVEGCSVVGVPMQNKQQSHIAAT